MAPIRFKDLLISFTTEFDLLWNDKGSGALKSASFWRPNTSADALNTFSSLGDVVFEGYRTINNRKVVAVVSEADKVNGTALRAPTDFKLVWQNSGKKVRSEVSVWRPIPPEGYVTMGMVCCVGYDKPSVTTVRCVRADLVVDAYIGNPIWNDKGSGSRMDFSTWDVHSPEAEPGEAYIAPGTFFGNGSFARPSFGARPYALRMELALQQNPLPAPAEVQEPAQHPANVCDLPWFAVKDSNLTPIEQLQSTPTYRLERSDRYLSVGVGHNTTAEGKTFNWTARRGENGDDSIDFTAITGIDFSGEWSSIALPLSFSANLDKLFTHTSQSAKGWGSSASLEVAAYVPANQTVAAHLIRSEYRLLRQDGSQLSATVGYTNGDTVYFSDSTAVVPAENPLLPPPAEPIAADDEQAPPPAAENTLEIMSHDFIDDTLLP